MNQHWDSRCLFAAASDKSEKMAFNVMRGLHGALVALCLLGLPWMAGAALAQQGTAANYPSRPVRVIVPVPPGGGHDIIGRVITAALSEGLGIPFVVDNRPGGGQTLGTSIAAKAQPDGYTLMVAAAGFTIAPFMFPATYDVARDFAPITQVTSQPLLLAVHPGVKANTVPELIALARARPNELNIALADPGGSGSLAAELFKMVTQTRMVSVPYKGGAQALIALMSNEVQVVFTTPAAAMQHLKTGRLRIIGTTGAGRVSYLPDTPTLAEAGIRDFEIGPWQGLVAPAKTPALIIDRLYRQMMAGLKLSTTRERLAASGAEIVGSSPKEFGVFINRELARNSKVIKAAGLKAE